MNLRRNGIVLLVDDDPELLQTTLALLDEEGYRTLGALTAGAALKHLDAQQDQVGVMLADLQLPDMNGLDLLRETRRRDIDLPVVMITGHGSERTAVQAMKAGALDYITKPIVDPHELFVVIDKALADRHKSLSLRVARDEISLKNAELLELRRLLGQMGDFHGIIGQSKSMLEVYQRIQLVADTRSTVLITGESGTGKELVARAIHELSDRRTGPFMAINCAAIPESLLESELFGHEKGAFTGATGQRVGKFQAGHRGTLLIDELGDLKLDLQAKLLRVLETRRFSPVGGNREIETDVRVLAATSRALDELTAENKFRSDLYYRVNVVSIHLPPLRQRKDDIPLLVDAFVKTLARENERPIEGIDRAAVDAMMQYDWPGNVRELRNCVESMVVLSRNSMLTVRDLPQKLQSAPVPPPAHPNSAPASEVTAEASAASSAILPEMSLAELERRAIQQALSGSPTHKEAAERLGISIRTLQRRMKDYGML